MTSPWRDNLKAAWEASGLSKRRVSIKAGLHAGFLHEVDYLGKCPSIDNFIALARALNVSPSKLIDE